MSRLWILTVLGLIAVLGIACGDSGDDQPQSVSSATLTASAPATPLSSASATTTAIPSPTVAATLSIPADWPTFSSPDGAFTLRYPSNWFAVTPSTPPPSPQAQGYTLGLLFSIDPNTPHPTFPPNGAKVDLEVSLPGSGDCPAQPSVSTSATVGGVAGWRLTPAEPNDFGLTSDSFGAYFAGRCYSVTGYFGSASHDQATFEQMIKSFTFASSLR